MLNSIVNYGRFPTIVSAQSVLNTNSYLDALTDVTTPETLRMEAVMESIPNVLYRPATAPS